jgi:hypothetical protein
VPADQPRRPSKHDEALIVEKLLRQLPQADPTLSGERRVVPKPPAPPAGSQAAGRGQPAGWQRAWGWTALAAIIGVGLTQWPYARSCGFPLLGYGAAVVVFLVTALRAAHASWRDRRGLAHVVALLSVIGGLALVAEVVLPRAGYARDVATWRCRAPAPPTRAPATASPPTDAAPATGAGEAPPVTPRQGPDST